MRVRKAFGFVGAGWGVLRAHACCLDLGMCVHETRECVCGQCSDLSGRVEAGATGVPRSAER